MKKNIQILFIILIANINLAMTQNQSLCTVSDIFISEHGQFILSTVVNNKIEKKISLISNLKKNQLDTLDIPFENVSRFECIKVGPIKWNAKAWGFGRDCEETGFVTYLCGGDNTFNDAITKTCGDLDKICFEDEDDFECYRRTMGYWKCPCIWNTVMVVD